VRIRWLDQAVADLVTVRNYIAQDDPGVARKVAQSIRQAVAVLTDYPAAGRPGRVPNTRELIVANTAYILPHRVRGGVGEILRVLHGARKWAEKF
jgi:toxin ParE1/3/4